MTYIRRLILALALSAGLAPAFAQVPPPVPALPDTERRVSYSISGTTCACAINMALYGDGTDYQNWIEVFINGVRVDFNDTTFGWTVTSPSGSLSTLARPITNAVLTFTGVQTGTVQIVGARRPRRTSQFNEGAGVPTRNFNQVLTDIIATQRELWDKTNDFTGRSVRTPPGETLALLPVLASRQNMGACFDSSGNLNSCVAPSGSFAAGTGITFTGTNPTTISAGTAAAQNIGTSGANVPLMNGNNTWSGTNIWNAITTFFANVVFQANAYFGGVPWIDVKSGSHSCPVAALDGVTDDTVAIQCYINYMYATYTGGTVFVPPGVALINTAPGLVIKGSVKLNGSGKLVSYLSTTVNGITTVTFNALANVGGCRAGSELSNFSISNFTGATPNHPAVLMDVNCAGYVHDNEILYGNYGLQNNGVDSYIVNNYIWGFTGALLSGGANWYIRDKFDQPAGTAATYGINMGQSFIGAGIMENHFIQCDVSGSYTDSSLSINDLTSTQAVTKFEGTVFSSPVKITNSKVTILSVQEFGSTTITVASGFLIIAASYAFNATTVTGAGTRSCAANVNLTC